ncbi:hypothetical protein RA307_18525 [Xanthobacteraceae bacterium Astr-EGSB]|uniref:hypothetical protein n=1 Tax=Astrobacterium formosum TaxID=3069710 RepID=UPI0027B58322|nr:hypothetical protein [Xanthobacteraceae bacterium Astr-EGSB]
MTWRVLDIAKAAVRRLEQNVSSAASYSLMNHLQFVDFAERALLLQGRALSNNLRETPRVRNLGDVEFRVFSQWGEDGIIDWLVDQIALPNHRFVEFGVENFREANCRFLMQNRNWRGLVFDGSTENMKALRSERMFWMHDLTATTAFITADNINGLIEAAGFGGPLGILSIDIDGNDYWVWKAIDCVQPAIVICEYNAVLGDRFALTIPYAPDFQRLNAHPSGQYFGASILALRQLGEEKGYDLVGTNTNGVNAFFVRKDLAGQVLSRMDEVRAFPSRHRDSRDETGALTFVGGRKRIELIADMPVVDLSTGNTVRLGQLDQPYSADWQD